MNGVLPAEAEVFTLTSRIHLRCLLESHTTRWRLSAVQTEPNYLLCELLAKIAADVQVRFEGLDLGDRKSVV